MPPRAETTRVSRNSLSEGWSPTKKNGSEKGTLITWEMIRRSAAPATGCRKARHHDPVTSSAERRRAPATPTGRDGLGVSDVDSSMSDGPESAYPRTARSPSERQPVEQDRYRCGRASVGATRTEGDRDDGHDQERREPDEAVDQRQQQPWRGRRRRAACQACPAVIRSPSTARLTTTVRMPVRTTVATQVTTTTIADAQAGQPLPREHRPDSRSAPATRWLARP